MLNTPAPHRMKRAFTLVELLVVIAIIAVIIALLFPALNAVNKAGKRNATQNMLNAFSNAVSSFSSDNGSRMPGYFSQYEMGSEANEAAGMSAMENIMLELSGTDVVLGSYVDFQNDVNRDPDDSKGGIISIAPFLNSEDNAAVVNTTLIGSNGAYFAPDSNFLKVLNVDEGQQRTTKANGQHLMPDLVDAFGNPILAWVQDVSSRGSIDPNNDNPDGFQQFASITSDGSGDGNGPAWFYLASNACFIGDDTVGIGQSGANQNAFSALSTSPLNNNSSITEDDRVRSLTTLLASPSYYALPSGITLDDANTDEIYPSRPRGTMIVQSPGVDGVYLSTNDPGWRTNADTTGGAFHIGFAFNFKNDSGRFQDADGQFITYDVIEEFDDIIQAVN